MFIDRNLFGLKRGSKDFDGDIATDVLGTGEQIDADGSVLGPGVNR